MEPTIIIIIAVVLCLVCISSSISVYFSIAQSTATPVVTAVVTPVATAVVTPVATAVATAVATPAPIVGDKNGWGPWTPDDPTKITIPCGQNNVPQSRVCIGLDGKGSTSCKKDNNDKDLKKKGYYVDPLCNKTISGVTVNYSFSPSHLEKQFYK